MHLEVLLFDAVFVFMAEKNSVNLGFCICLFHLGSGFENNNGCICFSTPIHTLNCFKCRLHCILEQILVWILKSWNFGQEGYLHHIILYVMQFS